MLKNICTYSALILLSLVVLASAVSANSPKTDSHRFGPAKIDRKSSGFYNKFLTIGTPQSYSVTVKEGEETTVKIHSDEGVSVKLYLPNGEVKEYREEKNFSLEFRAAGEYVIELQSSNFSKYTLNASTK